MIYSSRRSPAKNFSPYYTSSRASATPSNHMKKTIKVIHLPTTVGGNPQGLSQHLNTLGMDSVTWTLRQNHFGYPADKVLQKESDSLILAEFKRLLALRYVFQFDVVFFNFGQTLFTQIPKTSSRNKTYKARLVYLLHRFYATVMQRLELFLLKALKRPLFIQYQGDDARQGDYSITHFSISIAKQVGSEYYTPASDELKRQQIKLLTRVCAKTYALNPDLLHVLPDSCEFLPYSHIDLNEWDPCYTQMDNRLIRIGHAPSNRAVKGTDLILASLKQLELEGYQFELILVEGLSNAEAKERYKTVDVLVDQLFAGWYGGLAVELMALGKPVVVYIRDEDLKFLPPEMANELPVIRVTPDSILEILRKVLDTPREDLLALGKQSRSYVERWHNPLVIAGLVKSHVNAALNQKRGFKL